jgi:predicted nucleic acid-binding protein
MSRSTPTSLTTPEGHRAGLGPPAHRRARTWLTFVSVGELLKWAQVRDWGEIRRARLDAWDHRPPGDSYDREIARVWGHLAGNAQRRGRPRPHNDMWVAACCIRIGVPLITLNRKDFADLAEHDGLSLLDERD